MAGLCYVTPVTGHKAYTEKEEEEEDNYFDLLSPFSRPASSLS
jgi:hypothetical protein